MLTTTTRSALCSENRPPDDSRTRSRLTSRDVRPTRSSRSSRRDPRWARISGHDSHVTLHDRVQAPRSHTDRFSMAIAGIPARAPSRTYRTGSGHRTARAAGPGSPASGPAHPGSAMTRRWMRALRSGPARRRAGSADPRPVLRRSEARVPPSRCRGRRAGRRDLSGADQAYRDFSGVTYFGSSHCACGAAAW